MDSYDPFAEAAPAAQAAQAKRPRSPEPVVASTAAATLAGVLRQPFLKRRVLCSHFLNNDCRWGDDCRFSHDADELRSGAPATTEMDFSNLESGLVTRTFKIPKRQAQDLMTEATRLLLAKAAGDCGVSWEPEAFRVTMSGTSLQVERAGQLLKRLSTHCNWGVSRAKIEGILCPAERATARIRLSPMATTLKQASVSLTISKPQFTIGSGASNDLVVKGPLMSRAHTLLEFSPSRGALYVVDLSTNGTFLNGVRLPCKSSGKVFVCHGDELLFPEAKQEVRTMEFGYMVNLELV